MENKYFVKRIGKASGEEEKFFITRERNLFIFQD